MFEIIFWYFIFQIISIINLPLTLNVFKNLPDRGYSINKAFALLMLSFFVYFFTMIIEMEFNYFSVILSLISMFILSILNYRKKNFDIFKEKNMKVYVKISEFIFLSIFIIAIFFKSIRPDLDHGEGPMDIAYINSILRSEKLPPPYPWLAGVNLENVYYYFGHFSYAILIKLNGIESSKGYVLSLTTVFSLIAICSFSFGYNLSKNYKIAFLCMFLITFGSSLLGLIHLINSINPNMDFHITDYKMSAENDFNWRFFYGASLFWWSTRVIPWTITEFPWFSLLWGDLHAHFMSYSFILTFAHLILDVFFSEFKGIYMFGSSFSEIFQKIILLSISLGYMFPQFIWNYPLYVAFLFLTLFFMFYDNIIKPRFLIYFLSFSLIILILSVIFYFKPIKNLLKLNPDRSGINFEDLKTPIFNFTVLYGLQIFLIFSYFTYKFYKSLKSKLSKNMFILLVCLYLILYLNVSLNFFEDPKRFDSSIKVNWLGLKSIIYDFQLSIVLIPFTLSSLYFLFWKKYSNKIEMFLLIMILFGTIVVWIYEIFNIYGRYVFVFKLHQSVWIFWNASSALILYCLFNSLNFRNILNFIFISVFVLLLTSSFIYLIVTSITETDIFRPNYGRNYLSIDSLEFAKTNYPEEYKLIKWINKNIKGNHVILEYPDESYKFDPKISTFTGLQSFVQWKGHAEQVSLKNTNEIAEIANLIYNSTNVSQSLKLIKDNNIEFIYIGEKEVENYCDICIEKFKNSKFFDIVYKSDNIVLYKFIQ